MIYLTICSYNHIKPKAMTRLYSSDDNIIQEYANEKRVFIPYEAIPKLLIEALL